MIIGVHRIEKQKMGGLNILLETPCRENYIQKCVLQYFKLGDEQLISQSLKVIGIESCMLKPALSLSLPLSLSSL